MALNLIFMGTSDFAVPILNSIYKSDHKILTVYTQPPKKSNRGQKISLSPVHNFCKKNNLNVIHPYELNENENKRIANLSPDVVVVVAYGKIIPSQILDNNKIMFLNVHASLLPRWRGAAPIQRSLIEMDKETGISIMKIVNKLDAGPIMLKEKISIQLNDTFISLSKKLSDLGSKMILNALKLIEKNNINLFDQDKNGITYAKKIDKKESEVNWNIDSKNLAALIRGLNPSPGVWFKHKNFRLKIIKAFEVEKSGRAGEVLDNNLTIACKHGAIKILEIQKEGKKILSSIDFLKGYKISKGEILL